MSEYSIYELLDGGFIVYVSDKPRFASTCRSEALTWAEKAQKKDEVQKDKDRLQYLISLAIHGSGSLSSDDLAKSVMRAIGDKIKIIEGAL